MSETKEAAAELFLLLAGLWKPPDENYWEEVSEGTTDDELVSLSAQAGHISWWHAETLQQNLVSLELLQSFYVRYFVGVGRLTALPIESIYKKWTEDPSARLPIASSTGYLMGDPAVHIRYLLEQYGLDVPPDYRMMPDHLVLLLELAAFLVEKRTIDESRIFCSQHLDWLDKLEQVLVAAASDDDADAAPRQFYRAVLQASQQAIAAELQRYSAIQG